MLYHKLAYKNVRASFHDYLLYFLTLALTVSASAASPTV